MSTVVLSGAADSLGRRVAAALGQLDGVERIIALDEHDLHGRDLKVRIEGADAVIHLSGGVDETRAVLDAAGAVGAAHVVLMSSATAYGAWANNPVPLTEDAPLRPNPDLDFAVRAAERERLAADWKHEHPGTTVAVLRPAVPLAEDASGWLARGLRETSAIRAAGPDDPPGQYVHLDDVTAAIVLALTSRLDGPFNVSPDRWIAGDQLRALAGVPCACPSRWRGAWPGCGGDSIPRARRPVCCRTRCIRGWWPTTGSRPRVGCRRSATKRRTSPGIVRRRGRRSALSAVRRSHLRAPPRSLSD